MIQIGAGCGEQVALALGFDPFDDYRQPQVAREWADPQARLNGALQLAKGLAKAAG